MRTLYRIISEWDFGHEDLVFESEAAARDWLRADVNVQEVVRSCAVGGIEDLFKDGLLRIKTVDLL